MRENILVYLCTFDVNTGIEKNIFTFYHFQIIFNKREYTGVLVYIFFLFQIIFNEREYTGRLLQLLNSPSEVGKRNLILFSADFESENGTSIKTS